MTDQFLLMGKEKLRKNEEENRILFITEKFILNNLFYAYNIPFMLNCA